MKHRWSVGLVCLVAGATAGGYFLNPVLRGQGPGVPAIPRELTSYRDIVKKVLPAVVSIEARAAVAKAPGRVMPQRPPRLDNPNGPDEFRRMIDADIKLYEGVVKAANLTFED